MRLDLLLERRTKYRLNPDTTRTKLRKAAEPLRRPPHDLLVRVGKPRRPTRDGESYRSTVLVRLEGPQAKLKNAQEVLQRRVAPEGWAVSEGESLAPVGQNGQPPGRRPPPFDPPALTGGVFRSHFSGVFDREPHVRLMHDAALAFAKTRGRTRGHVLLYGKPASCKTTLLERFRSWYGPAHVVFIDGPTLSKAGLENWLLEQVAQGSLPAIVAVEEVEKMNLDNLLVLLSLMGSGRVMKTNARIGRVCVDANSLVWGTCNDENVVRAFRNGALWSRFAHRLYCKRPTREQMTEVLKAEAVGRGGEPAWALEAIRLGYEVLPRMTGEEPDPRAARAFLDGGERLLDGTYEADVLEVLGSRRDELGPHVPAKPPLFGPERSEQPSPDEDEVQS